MPKLRLKLSILILGLTGEWKWDFEIGKRRSKWAQINLLKSYKAAESFLRIIIYYLNIFILNIFIFYLLDSYFSYRGRTLVNLNSGFWSCALNLWRVIWQEDWLKDHVLQLLRKDSKDSPKFKNKLFSAYYPIKMAMFNALTLKEIYKRRKLIHVVITHGWIFEIDHLLPATLLEFSEYGIK